MFDCMEWESVSNPNICLCSLNWDSSLVDAQDIEERATPNPGKVGSGVDGTELIVC